MPNRQVPGLVHPNRNGGYYHPGCRYEFTKKMSVGSAYLELWQEFYPIEPSINAVAKRAKVGWNYADRVVTELQHTGTLIDPLTYGDRTRFSLGVGECLSVEEDVFLLSLRAEDPGRPNLDYIAHLQEAYGKTVSSQFISNWFKKRFKYSGDFRKPNLVPIDKFRPGNIKRYLEYRVLLDLYEDHTRFNFLDEKHLVNKDVLPTKTRADPLTGFLDAIPVSGDFREAYNLMAIILANPRKRQPVGYTLGKENGCGASFCYFIHTLIVGRYFWHDEVVIMDNARIHTGGDAEIVEDMLWTTVIDGRPLHVHVLYLPTRSPELNPIELVFHILARRIRSYRYALAGPSDQAVLTQTKKVLNDMSYETILKCFLHCGY